MPSRRRPLKSEGTALPPPHTFSKGSIRLSEKGLLTFAEIAVGTLIIALLIVVAVSTLRVTEKGTISQKMRQQALNLAKARAEELKSYIGSQNWDNIQVDVRFPPTQTPAVASYRGYAPQTVTLGLNTFIVDPEVRYVNSDSTNQIVLIPTPGTVGTPEISDMVRVRVDSYYGPVSEFIPLPTAEIQGPLMNRMVYSNIVAHNVIAVGGVGQISGYVYINCNSAQPVTNTSVEVGLYVGVQKLQSALTDNYGFFSFTSVPAGVMSLQVVSCPGYQPVAGYACNFTNPVTLTAGNSLNNLWLGVTPLTVQAYYGVVMNSAPLVFPVIPTSPTPTPNPLMTPVPLSGAIVFADDGNSLPVTSSASGAYTITQVRATPVATHLYDTLEADSWATTQMGKNYNVGTGMTTGNYVSGGVQYIGPITIFINSTIANTQPVTFYIKDEQGGNLTGSYYPVTLSVQDGSASPPSTIITASGASGPFVLNVHQGAPIVNVDLKNNTSPPAWVTYHQPVNVDASLTSPVTLPNYAVGSAAGTIAGMGAGFDYTLFTIRARDDQGQFVYNIPVVYDGASTFGTFSYQYLRTPLNVGGDLIYNFTADGGGDYTSTTETKDIQKGTTRNLDNTILVTPLNVYANVTVTKGGPAYPYGAWISAQPGSLAAPVTSGMGNGYSVTNYFSTVTKGDGTGQVQVQLVSGSSTTYTFFAQIVDPTTYALSTKAVTVTMTNAYNFANPKPITFTFP